MRNYKMSGKVKVNFNDSKDNMKFYKAGEDTFTADRARYEELYSRYEELYYKGYVEEGKEVKDYLQTDKKEKKED